MRVAAAALFLTFVAGSALANPHHPPVHPDPHGAPAPLIGAGAPMLLAGASLVAAKLLRRKR